MAAAALIPIIMGGIDIVSKMIRAYNNLPDKDVEFGKRLDELTIRLEDTKREVAKVKIKDV